MSNSLEESWFVNQSREQTSLAPVLLELSLWIMAASDLAFSGNFPCFHFEECVSSQDLTQHVSVQKSP